jgi:hypothetical protein
MPNGMFAYKTREHLQQQDEERASSLLSSLTARVKEASKEEVLAAERAKVGSIYAEDPGAIPPMVTPQR